VLLDFDFESSLSRLLPATVADPAARLERLLERKDEFETGRITIDAYIAWALEVTGSDATADEFCHAWQQIFTPCEPMWRCVRQLAKEGHRLILFSNTNGIHCRGRSFLRNGLHQARAADLPLRDRSLRAHSRGDALHRRSSAEHCHRP
jgi:hypothetical protein